jgi:small-conductance mechanosensitive channel
MTHQQPPQPEIERDKNRLSGSPILGRLLSFALVAILIVAVSAVLVWPLWRFAMTNKPLFSAFVGFLVVALAVWGVLRQRRRRQR